MITVLALAANDAAGHEFSILETSKKIPYKCKKLIFSITPPKDKNIQWVPIEDWGGDYRIYSHKMNEFCFKKIINYIDTEFFVFVQSDGFAVNSNAWTDDFFSYDYIGAPLPLWETLCIKGSAFRRVGSGGFCFRSKKFLEIELKCGYNPMSAYSEDIYVTRVKHKFFEKEGCKYAPIEVALKWCLEHKLEDYPKWNPNNSFGFHGLANGKPFYTFSPFGAFLLAVKRSLKRRKIL